jgi:peptidoglycan-associated lipoprotein
MASRGLQVMMTSLLVMSVAMAGCAKRPATTQATAPAPTGATGTTRASTDVSSSQMQPGGATAQPATAQPGSGTAGGAPGTAGRPDVKTFTAVPELADVNFDFDRYDIRPTDTKILDANAQWLKSNPNHLVLIEGHCDERGTNEYNLALGERRAKSTMNYLVAQGVQANRITIISYGEERPLCGERSESCWAKNRRAHFLVKPR